MILRHPFDWIDQFHGGKPLLRSDEYWVWMCSPIVHTDIHHGDAERHRCLYNKVAIVTVIVVSAYVMTPCLNLSSFKTYSSRLTNSNAPG